MAECTPENLQSAEDFMDRGGLTPLGRGGAQTILNFKEETLLKPGNVTQLPFVKQFLSVLNPSVSTDRGVVTSYAARGAVMATEETRHAAMRLDVRNGLKEAWQASKPKWAGKAAYPHKDELANWLQHPDLYEVPSQELRLAADAYDDVSNQILERARGDFGVEIQPFSGAEGSVYVPTVQTRESLDAALDAIGDGFTSSSVSGKAAVNKRRAFEGAYDRWLKDNSFRAEMNIDELTSVHDRAVAQLMGNETFKLGTGGQTRLSVMKDLHPNLFDKMIKLRLRVQNLSSTSGRLDKRIKTALDDFMADPDSKLEDLSDALDIRVTRGQNKGADVDAINAELQAVRQEIRELRPAWDAADLRPFVRNKNTFRYHEAEKSEAIDKILDTKLNLGDGILNAIDEVRLTAFAGDFSPLTIQGLLGVLSDPITAARSMPDLARAGLDGDAIARVAADEADDVARFTTATGRPFGRTSAEFRVEGRGLERLPIIGKGIGNINEKLLNIVEMLRYKQFKVDSKLAHNGGKTQNVADAEAANSLSKAIPALNSAERGVSVVRARAERFPVISPSFLGGPPTMIKDAASGLVKATANLSLTPAGRWAAMSGREQLAILHLSSMAGTLATASIATHMASGWSPEDAVKDTLDPDSPRFLSIALGGDRRIPIGGPLRSTIKAFLPTKTGEVNGVPVYVPFKGVPDWLRGKATPGITAPINLIRNKDYFGESIRSGGFLEQTLRSVWYGANAVIPLALAEPSEALRRGEVKLEEGFGAARQLAERGVAQLGGVDLRETSPFELFTRAKEDEFRRSKDAGELPNITVDGVLRQPNSYEELKLHDSPAADLIDNSAPVLAAQEKLSGPHTEQARGFEAGKELQTLSKEEQEGNDDRLKSFFQSGEGLSPSDWQDAQRERQRDLFVARDAIFDFVGIEFEERDAPSGSVNDAINKYFSVDVDEFTDNNTLEVNWSEFFAEREKAMAGLSATDRQRVDDLLKKFETDTERAFRTKIESRLDPYFALDPSSDNPVKAKIDANNRKLLRIKDPKIDSALYISGVTGVTSVYIGSRKQVVDDIFEIFGIRVAIDSIPIKRS